MARGQTVASRAVVTAVGMGIQGVARFGYTWAIANFVGQTEVGVANSLISVALFAALVWPQGTGVAATRFMPVPGEAKPAVTWLRRSFLISLVWLSVGGGVVASFLVRDVVLAVSAVALLVAYSGYCFTRGVLLAQDRITHATIWDTITSALSLGTLVLVILGQISWAMLLPLAVGYAVFTIVNWPREPGEQPTSDGRSSMRAFTRDASIAALASGGLLPLTMMMVKAFDTDAVAGNFAVAMQLATPANMLALALNQVLVPHFSRMRSGSAEALRLSHRKTFIVANGGLVLVFLVLIAIAPWLLQLFFGDTYADGTLPLRILLVIVMMLSLMSVPGAYLTAVGFQREYAQIWAISFVIGAAVLAVAAPAWGQWGALLGYGLGACGGAIAVIALGLTAKPRLVVPLQPA